MRSSSGYAPVTFGVGCRSGGGSDCEAFKVHPPVKARKGRTKRRFMPPREQHACLRRQRQLREGVRDLSPCYHTFPSHRDAPFTGEEDRDTLCLEALTVRHTFPAGQTSASKIKALLLCLEDKKGSVAVTAWLD